MRSSLIIVVLIGVVPLVPASARAQATDTPPSASAPAPRTDQPTEQTETPRLEVSFGVQSGAPSAGPQKIVPWAARGDNTAYRPAAADGAVSK